MTSQPSKSFRIIQLDESLNSSTKIFHSQNKKPLRAIALGMFDGVHLGHQELIEQVLNQKKNGFIPCVTTFEEPSIKWTQPQKKIELVTTLKERLLLLKKYGIEEVIVLNFPEVSQISANDYFKEILINELNCRFLTCGSNHHFGKNKTGSIKELSEWSKNESCKFIAKQLLLNSQGKRVSSSLIRENLTKGLIKEANQLMGHCYLIEGQTKQGEGLGNKIGFPTINIEYNKDKVQIPNAVYSSTCLIDGKKYYSITNIGFAPTLKNLNKPLAETFILNAGTNFMLTNNNPIILELHNLIRLEQKFEDLESLQSQITIDVEKVKAEFTL